MPALPPAIEANRDRRGEVVEATCRVIARDGLDKASMRAIAQELGCSTGVLTHYFRDKEAMFDLVLAQLMSHFEATHAWVLSADNDPGKFVRYVCAILPDSPDTIRWWTVWLAFTAASLGTRRPSSAHDRFYASLRDVWTRALQGMIDRGQLRADLDPAIEADTLLALVDGLGVQALISPQRIDRSRRQAIVRAHVERLANRA